MKKGVALIVIFLVLALGTFTYAAPELIDVTPRVQINLFDSLGSLIGRIAAGLGGAGINFVAAFQSKEMFEGFVLVCIWLSIFTIISRLEGQGPLSDKKTRMIIAFLFSTVGITGLIALLPLIIPMMTLMVVFGILAGMLWAYDQLAAMVTNIAGGGLSVWFLLIPFLIFGIMAIAYVDSFYENLPGPSIVERVGGRTDFMGSFDQAFDNLGNMFMFLPLSLIPILMRRKKDGT